MSDYPFKAEYAKSGRAACKTCKNNIGQDSLRLAVMVQSPMFDGKVPNWNHYTCFWKRNRVKNASDFHGFDGLRWEDQKKIEAKVAEGGGGDGGGTAANEFKTEYAKTGKSRCRGCEEYIAKAEVRISKKDYETQRAKMYGPQDMWFHVDCFISDREALEFGTDIGASSIPGFAHLSKEDQDMLVDKLGKGETAKKRKAEDKKEAGGKKAKVKETEEDKKLKEQSQLIWQFRDLLQKNVSNEAMRIMLEINDQDLPSGESRLLDAMADCLSFGALKRCPECKSGQLVNSTYGYKCTGNMTEWTKCQYLTRSPERVKFKVPKEYHDVEFLKSYKYTKRERVFPARAEKKPEGAISSQDSVDAGPSQPLDSLKFVICGKTSKSKAELTKAISELGGKVVSKVDDSVAACISTKDEVEKKSKHIKDSEKADVQVVSEDFLEKVKKGGAALMITECNIASWGSDPSKRIEEKPPTKSFAKSAAFIRSEKMFTKSVPATQKLKLKGGAAVDPDSGLDATAHVISEKGAIYNAVLGMVDIVKGTNSYYKLQALEDDSKNKWYLFRAWGRVGTTIGGNKLEKCGSRNSAVDKFQDLYAEKTGNEFENRNKFEKIPNKFYPLDIDYGQDDGGDVKQDLSGSRSKLEKPVQDLVRMLFDIESMKKAMLEFEIDLKKMPLGKLSRKQMQSAYKILNELQNLVENKGTPTQFLDASNRFYTLIPHDFGMKKPPLLDTAKVIQTKTEMVDNLLEIEVAYSLLKGGDEGEDPIDAHYKKLKTKIEPIDKSDDVYKRLIDFVKNTHASTHNQYDLEVLDIFTIAREGEAARYRPFKDLHNKKLLWHGSRITNYAGILSQGLRIAPPEAPVTGYMFGKGVYFADMVSKSANYCRTSKADPIGILLLCEVALGNTFDCLASNYVTTLPKGKHSTKGCGMTYPDPAGSYTTKDGVEIPMGKSKNASERSSLLYNEFIVYDVAQIEIKYLLKTNFKYRW